MSLKLKSNLGSLNLQIPPIIFGTSCLGNLYNALTFDEKRGIMKKWFTWVSSPVAIDTAGKYGAGLALEVIGKGLKELDVDPQNIIISNKLGWFRTALTAPEPTFEPGVWVDLQHDAIQKISYNGILECYKQGLELLGGNYTTDIVSVHDPDEYLAAATSDLDRKRRLSDIIEAYKALNELKKKGEVKAVGIGAKDWKVIRELTGIIDMDWVMLAVSLTIMNQPPELIALIDDLSGRGVGVINSAVFHSGFLTGGAFFDYMEVDPENETDKALFTWRESFNSICSSFNVKPAEACVAFGMSPPGVISIALNTSNTERIKQNVDLVQATIPEPFWLAMKEKGLIRRDYPYLG